MDNTYKVNRFNMPLLQIIGTTGLHKSFSVGFGLTAKEDEGAFQWILSQLREAGRQADIPDPGVVITDFDTALKNALDSIFPSTQQQVFNMPHNWQISALSNKMIVKMTMETQYYPGSKADF
ncbi:MULE transposase domain-containing protein [Hirsutella rhossiliensis]|uniref:MULE transposase domain-containing protein n=1 Tax=Hirsutella rhossiliensis TaxID=111463 RepID=A0A9P8MWA3_9HYPO|nr:MULE transposase domain-containing protein [Hirsutella rhossiliensis]KAH0962552.1 MULE transposase domain-containing protein [Hirsutella rhossiliensis]